jgi:hypothetical protein
MEKIKAKTSYNMLIKCGVVFVNCNQVVVGNINFLHNGTIALDSKALVTDRGCGERTNLSFPPKVFNL